MQELARVMTPSANVELETVEMKLLLEGLYQYYGFDFRQYAPASLRRRIKGFQRAEKLPSISALQACVLHDTETMERLLKALTVHVSAMFRDPDFFRAIREQVVPILRTYPLVRIWCAGCSTGEEAYSLAILLHEEGIYDRCRIYATDLHEHIVRQARDGIFPLGLMREYDANYRASGGMSSLSDYYTAAYDHVMMRPSLRRHIIFAPHNLACDASFNEFQMILCRNAMIYFSKPLQDRVHALLYESLCVFGFLGLGSRESLRFTAHEQDYREIGSGQRLYQRIR